MPNDYLDYELQYTLVEVTNNCNLRCPMCPQAIEGGVGKKGFMDFKTFKGIVDNFPRKKKPNALKLFWLGEPMLHPRFGEYLKYAIEKLGNPRGFEYITFDTNGTMMGPEISEVILSAGDLIPTFTISMDAINEVTYEKIRRGGNFKALVDNVSGFLKMRREKELLYPAVTLQFILMEENHSEVLDFIDFWKGALKNNYVPGPRHHKDIIWIKRKDCPLPDEQAKLSRFYVDMVGRYGIKSEDLGFCKIGAEISNDLREK